VKKPKAIYNVERVVADMSLRGWNNLALARAAGLSPQTITDFLSGDRQTAKTADKIARALGYTVRRYFIRVEAVV